MKRVLLAGLLAATSLTTFAADKSGKPKKQDCTACRQCCDKACDGKASDKDCGSCRAEGAKKDTAPAAPGK